MATLKNFLFSIRTMTVLLLVYGVAMAVATFVENDYDTSTAKTLVYNSTWFEILMFWLILLFAANIKRYRLTRKEKWPMLVFHLAFIVLFIGGAVTRYIGFEGQMPIKEGSATNEIISDLTYFKLDVSDGKKTMRFDKLPYRMSYFNAKDTKWPLKRTFEQEYRFGDKTISLKSLDYIPLAKNVVQRTASGKSMLKIVSLREQGRVESYISEGETKDIMGLVFSFNNPVQTTVQLTEKDGVLMIALPTAGHYMSMEGQQLGVVTDSTLLDQRSGSMIANSAVTLNPRTLYTIENYNFIIPESAFKGKIVQTQGDKNDPMEKNLLDVIQLEINSGTERDTLLIKGGKGVTEYSETSNINGLDISVGFGSKILKTDFYLRCDDFYLERYPGSNNPSSYESKITVLDQGTEKQHIIFMNHVMDHKGYRFFQASYFPDETGTILSVNSDKWGTNITYFGYFLLFSGMFFTLFWKGTRFWKLNDSLKKMKTKNHYLFLLVLGIGTGSNPCIAQNNSGNKKDTISISQQGPGPGAQFARPGELGPNRIIDPLHAEKFGHLLIQDFQGRIKPINTHTLELLRKIYKKDGYRKGNRTISSDQWFISMQIDPGSWANEPLIKVGLKGGDKLLLETRANAQGYTSYSNLVDLGTGVFKLEEQFAKSFSKPRSDQSNYDKGLIEVTERFQIFSSIAYGYHTNIIPVKNDPDQTWRSWINSSGEHPAMIDATAYGLLTPYFKGAIEGLQTGNWNNADKSIETINAFQQLWGKNIVPSTAKVKLEILYNHLNIFLWLMIAYSLLGIGLVLLGFVEVFSSGSKYNHMIRTLIKTLLGAMVMALAIQATALGLRWYLSGHAPWSNGYEAIIFISGVGVLSGLLLYRNRNAFIPASGALVAMIMMGFAHGGSMLDPQITPLEPVLKSYWLMVHVGIITSSYGFFGLSAVLSSISLVLFSCKPSKKTTRSIKELTLVNEMALTVGIFALTIGTFLGGMWANESWGRNWSWDPKETWAFISVIFYAVVLHLRLIPGLKGKLTFNIVGMWAIWSIIFTYFGVNYYLSGLHSYAAGDPMPIPAWIYIAAAGMFSLSLLAFFRNVGTKGQRSILEKV